MALAALNRMMKDVEFKEDDPNKKSIGKGAFGEVFLSTRRAHKGQHSNWPEIEVAVKRSILPVTETKAKQMFMSEIEVLAKLKHPACLSLIAFSLPPNGHYLIVTEVMAEGLDKIIAQATKAASPDGWDNTAKSIVALGVASALGYLHSQNIIHRDVKPENILLDSNFYPRVSDFGFAKIIPVDQQVQMTLGIGTSLYMAPELLLGEDYSYPVDVYAYGMMLFVIMTDSLPFKGVNVAQKIMSGERPDIPSYVPDNCRALIEQCWDTSPVHRPTFADILENPENLRFGNCDETAFDNYKVDVLKLI
jgi:serine/threonine protein kinase